MLQVEDDCKFTIDGDNFVAVIKEIYDDRLVVKPISMNYQSLLDGPLKPLFPLLTIIADDYDAFDLEFFEDGRGCDNSAIGIAGCYEPWTQWLAA
jgi:hypothetical protein|tara:strand:+ start:166 stop:450 length:285 start_codon:yes stop_codon:yes gene_type:complete